MNERTQEMMRFAHDYIGELNDGQTLAINERALEALESWSDDDLGGFIRLNLLLMRCKHLPYSVARFGVDQDELAATPASVKGDAMATRETAE